MLYPKKIKSKKIDIFLRIFILVLFVVSLLLLLINRLTTPNNYWSLLCILGFIYSYSIVRYSMTKRANLAGHVVIHMLLLAGLIFFIDYFIGFKGWSINIAFPIIIIIANVAMLLITIISYKHYEKYAVSQLIVTILSLSIIYLIHRGYAKASALINVSIFISLYNFIVSLVLCHRDFKEEIIRRINI